MNYNDDLKRIKLFMNYDSKKTLRENEEKIGLLLEGDGSTKSPYTDSDLQPDVDTVVDDIDGYVAEYNVESIYKILTKYKDKWATDTSNPDKPKTVSAIKLFADLYKLDEGENLKDDLESIGTSTFSNTAIKKLNDSIYYVKNYYSKAVPTPTTTTTTTKKPGGGGKGTIGVSNTNIANDDIKYWKALFDVLESAGYDPRTKGSAISTSSKFYVGDFTISRDSKPFICLNCPSPMPTESQLLTSGYTFANIDPDRNTTPGKYSGESDLSKLFLLASNTEKERPNLIDFLALTATKPGVKDKTGSKKTGTGTGTGTGKKTGTGTGTGTGTAFSWKSCSGTYSYGCKSPEVGQAQKCMGIKIDDKFGSGTLRTLRTRFGRTSFTDDYLKNVICAKQGSGSSNTGYEFDQESSTTQSGSDSGPSTFTGTVY